MESLMVASLEIMFKILFIIIMMMECPFRAEIEQIISKIKTFNFDYI